MKYKNHNILNSYETNNWFTRVLHRLRFCWSALTRSNYYLVSFKTNEQNNVYDIMVETYSCDNRGVKDLSIYLYGQFNGMDSATNQVNDILGSASAKGKTKNVIQVLKPNTNVPFYILKNSENTLKTVYNIKNATDWNGVNPDEILSALAITKDKFLTSAVELKDVILND